MGQRRLTSSGQPQLDNSDTGKESTLGRTPLAGAGAAPSFQWGANAYVQRILCHQRSRYRRERASPIISPTLGFSANVHEHTRTLAFDANYNFSANFYASGTVPTQINNYLQAVGDRPDHPGLPQFQPEGLCPAGCYEWPGRYHCRQSRDTRRLQPTLMAIPHPQT